MTVRVPIEIKDEERWLKVFPKTSFLIFLIGLFVVRVWCGFWGLFGFNAFAAITGYGMWAFLLIGSLIPPLGSTKVLGSRGISLNVHLLRKFIHKSNNAIYVKGIAYNEEDTEGINDYKKYLEEKELQEAKSKQLKGGYY